MASIQELKKVKNITLLFITVTILIFSSAFLYMSMDDKKENLEKDIKFKTMELDLVFTKKIFELQNIYNEKLESLINNNDELIDAFAKRDRKTLDKLAQVEFEKLMKENSNFEVMCFGLPNMTSFYRAQMPNKNGDDISGVHGVREVTKLKKRVSGFLLSKVGLMYRVTFPIYKDGKYVGLLAFGINLGFVNDYIYKKMKTQSAVLVETKVLKQSKWFDNLEEGSLGKYTVIASTGELIEDLKKSEKNIDGEVVRLETNGKVYNIIKKDIKGLEDKEMAKVILFQDITSEVNLYNIYLYSFIGVIGILILVLIYILISIFNKFLSTIIVINDDLKELNTNLEKRVEEEVNKNREKDEYLLQQAKNASLGEMIGNIAHQWRQPLSAITSMASGIKLNNELGILEENELNNTMDKIVSKAYFLSDTINTFRDFLKVDKEVREFSINDVIKKSLQIEEATFKNFGIEIIDTVKIEQDVSIVGIESELSQVLINIMNNAKDVLIQKKIEKPWVKIESEKESNKVVITIEDNAGGIPLNVMPKIFEPYFTTKHQSQGTGLGLHMSYRIIVESLGGRLYAKNTQNGAKFFIELPLDSNS